MKYRFILGVIWTGVFLGTIGFCLSVYTFTAPVDSLHVAGSFNPTGGNTYTLQSSISSTQVTIPLSSFLEPGSNIPYTMAYINTDVIYGTLNPSSNSNSEFISATGITQNTNGSAILTGVTRGLARTPGLTGCVASSTLAHGYPGQTQFILSNSPCFYEEFVAKKNDQTFSGINTFTISPIVNDANSSSTAQLASRQFVLNTAFQGAATSTETNMGIVQLANASQVGVGTASSTSGAPLVIPNKFATTTPGTPCTGGILKCIVATVNGKIAQAFYDLTQSFTFVGGLTTTGTTTISASSVVTNPLVLNGVPYKISSTQGASSTVLSTNGSGSLTWEAQSIGLISTTSSATTTMTTGGLIVTKTASCVPPLVVTGGGYNMPNAGFTTAAGAVVGVEVPVQDYQSAANVWTVAVQCAGTGASICQANNLTVYAICANP